MKKGHVFGGSQLTACRAKGTQGGILRGASGYLVVVAGVFLMVLGCAVPLQASPMIRPGKPLGRTQSGGDVVVRSVVRSTLVRFAGVLIRGYQRHVSGVLGDRCPLSPSCSEYGRQAVARHGLLGVPMIADRLVREPGLAAREGAGVITDPLDDHDRWMSQRP